jgi:hypothetical protein
LLGAMLLYHGVMLGVRTFAQLDKKENIASPQSRDQRSRADFRGRGGASTHPQKHDSQGRKQDRSDD